jgi:hypothetical protein
LNSIIKKLNLEKNIKSFEVEKPKILDYIENKISSKQTQKTILSALFILTGDLDFKTEMLKICADVNQSYREQKKTDKQKEYMISFQEVTEKVNKTIEDVKTNPTIENYQKCLAACFSSGVYAPPRRSEFANVKI